MLLHEFINTPVSAAERFLPWEEDDPEVRGAFRPAEAAAVNEEDLFFLEKTADELLIVFRHLDAGKGIKGALRRHTGNSRIRVAPIYGQVPAGAELGHNSFQVFLRAFQGWPDGVLLGTIGTQARP